MKEFYVIKCEIGISDFPEIRGAYVGIDYSGAMVCAYCYFNDAMKFDTADEARNFYVSNKSEIYNNTFSDIYNPRICKIEETFVENLYEGE